MSQLFLQESLLFIYNNLDDILFISYLLFILSFILHYFKYKFPKEIKPILDKVIVIENFENNLESPLTVNSISKKEYNALKKNSFCDSENLENKCKELGKNGKVGCNIDCCVWASNKNGGSCVQGNKEGPIMKKDAKLVNYDEYYFLNKKYKI